MQPYFQDKFYNPSGTYDAARSVKADIDAARATIAHWFGARPTEVIFTAGGTEANNAAIHGIMAKYSDKKVLVSSVEHDSVLNPAQNYSCTLIPVGIDGRVHVDSLKPLVADDVVLVSIQYANNETGAVHPIKQIAAILEEARAGRRARGIKTPLYFHVDACQAPAYLDVHVARLGVDLMTINAGKIYGPKQVGALYVRGGVELQPHLSGGGQERGIRSGTENVPGIIGLAKALDAVATNRHEESKRLEGLQQLWFKLLKETIPQAAVTGSAKFRLPNNVHITIPGQDNERLLILLDQAGIICAAGSACSASSEEPSHVLMAMGMSESDARSSLRFTMGRQTTEADVRRVITELSRLVA